MTSRMMTESNIEKAVKDLFDGLEFTREPEGLYDPLRYMINIGGKRIRPHLCLLTYSLYRDGDLDESILQPAAALEVFHSFTLIHDDIMDKADIRRGVPTVYRKWNENTAILSGDVMAIDSYKRIAKAPAAVLSRALDLFSTTAAQVCDGQQFDMDFETQQKVSVVDYMRMIELKTAALLAGSAIIGALLAGASDNDCQHLYNFAREVGLAFQLQDDLLDSYGDERLGKKIGGDILEGKKTILMIEAFSRANEEQREILRTTHQRKDLSDAEKISKIKALYDELGVPERVEQQIAQKFQKALSILDTLEVPMERTVELRRYAENLIGRKS